MPCGKTKLSKEDMERIKKHYMNKQEIKSSQPPKLRVKEPRLLKKKKKRRITEPKRFKFDTRDDFFRW